MNSKKTHPKATKALIQVVCITILGSCLTPIDRNSEYIGGQLVISGQISPLEETNILYISRTAFTERLPEPIPGALIKLFDDAGNEHSYVEDREDIGKYKLDNVKGIPGRSYFIRITLSDGEMYESTPERMPEAIGNDVIYHTIEPEEYTDQDGNVTNKSYLKIYTNASLPRASRPWFIKWHVEEVYLLSPTDFPDPFGTIPPPCFISQQVDPQKIVLFSRKDVRTDLISDKLVSSRLVDRSFKERHYFTTYQSSLTFEAYEYWRKTDIAANQVGSLFDPPPARVTGNIFNVSRQEEVHGYFQAVNQTFHRFYLLPDDLPFKMSEYCEYRADRNFSNYPSECLDCLSARNSSYARPPWF